MSGWRLSWLKVRGRGESGKLDRGCLLACVAKPTVDQSAEHGKHGKHGWLAKENKELSKFETTYFR